MQDTRMKRFIACLVGLAVALATAAPALAVVPGNGGGHYV
jgi:hypothetical protein